MSLQTSPDTVFGSDTEPFDVQINHIKAIASSKPLPPRLIRTTASPVRETHPSTVNPVQSRDAVESPRKDMQDKYLLALEKEISDLVSRTFFFWAARHHG